MQKSFFWGIFLGIGVFAADMLTKWYVYSEIPLVGVNGWAYPYNGIGVFKDFFGIEFSIVHAINKGAAWGTLSNFQIPLLVFRIVLIAGLCLYLIAFNTSRKYVIPLCLLTAGALGNVVDYFLYGYVIDMFKFVFWGYHYPIFNVADIAITIGIVWLIIASFVQYDTSTQTQ